MLCLSGKKSKTIGGISLRALLSMPKRNIDFANYASLKQIGMPQVKAKLIKDKTIGEMGY